jgi:hypothetical protein
MQEIVARAPLQRIARTIGTRRKATKLQLAILTGERVERFGYLKAYADGVRR